MGTKQRQGEYKCRKNVRGAGRTILKMTKCLSAPHHVLFWPHVDGDTPLLVLNVVNINIYIIYNFLKRRKMRKKKEKPPSTGKGTVFKEMNPIQQYYMALPGHWTNILHSVSLNWRPTRSNSKNPCFLLVSQGQKSEFSGRNLGRHTTFLFSNAA